MSEPSVAALARAALAASRTMACTDTQTKNRLLLDMAERLGTADVMARLAAANEQDVAAAAAAGLAPALIDRLRLTPPRIAAMAEGCRQVAALPDPVGETLEAFAHPNGMQLRKVRVPIGVIAIIYESRPNVTIDCAALCLKSGNAAILRGGKEAFHTNRALADVIHSALTACAMPAAAVSVLPTTDRAALTELLHLDDCVHCVIPRGGEGLIRFVAQHARMPVIKHYTGVCSVYLDAAADPAMAVDIVVNAKCQRPGVCNAAENLIVHQALLDSVLPRVAHALIQRGVELRADAPAGAALDRAGIPWAPASEVDWKTEYLALILAIKTVPSSAAATEFINQYGSGHSDAIITADPAAAAAFQQQVDAATVYWNASTRFTDGFEFGMGAEIGISTDRLHARGPMGLRELTSYKYLIAGTGQVRT
jgi:glutamate-5-semialdehyde dehydrogenase